MKLYHWSNQWALLTLNTHDVRGNYSAKGHGGVSSLK